MPHLIAFSGLPGVGKSTIAQDLSRRARSVYLRVDEIETALKKSSLKIVEPDDAGYVAVAAIASSNLHLGHDVIADTVNPIGETRSLWAETAVGAGARLLNVEVICSDVDEHRRRLETRSAEIEGHALPGWQEVLDRTYAPWSEPRLELDTALMSVGEAVEAIVRVLRHPAET